MKTFFVAIDMAGNEIIKLRLENAATAPTNPTIGQMYYNTVTKLPMIFNGTSWNTVGAVSDVKVNGTSIVVNGVADITAVPAVIITGQLTDAQIASAATWNQCVDDLADEIDRATAAEVELAADITALDGRVTTIEGLIPSQASADNQLGDKAFINSSIATATADFKGTYDVVDDLELTISATHAQIEAALKTKVASKNPNNNDYVFVSFPDPTETGQITKFERYKYTDSDSAWHYEFVLNNSSFTAAQWAAINSGITAALVAQITANKNAIEAEVERATAAEEDLDERLQAIEEGSILRVVKGSIPAGSTSVTLNLTGTNADVLSIVTKAADGSTVMCDEEISSNTVTISIASAITQAIAVAVSYRSEVTSA